MWNGSFYRRHMPHFQNHDRTYFVTFVTQGRWTLPPTVRDIVFAEIVRQHQQTAFVLTAVVMPDHVHTVLQPLWNRNGVVLAMSEILRLVKGRSSRAINLALSR